MKILFLAFVFLIITVSAKAQTLRGQVKHFENYYALETQDQEKIILPAWINAEKLSQDKGHEILIEGSLQYLPCADELEICPTGIINRVRWIQYQNTAVDSRHELYRGVVKRFKGRAVESAGPYDYIAIQAGSERIEIPDFLDASQLLVLQPEVTMVGEAIGRICTDMSAACGPSDLDTLSMLKLEF